MTERIRLLDVDVQNGPIADALKETFARVLSSGRFIMGPEVSAFESEVADYIGAKHAITVSSGTDALVASLMALDVGAGDEVITTPFTFFATGGAIARLGARPVFVDIDPTTFNIDVSQISDAITPHTKAIMPVHLFGQSCDLKGLMEVSQGIAVVEDAAQSLGSAGEGVQVGTVGEMGCYSFFPSKNLGGFGDGGLITTQDEERAEQLRVLRLHGSKPKYFHKVVGGNFRMDALQAALLRVKLPQLPKWTEARQANAARYDNLFAKVGLSEITPHKAYEGHVYNQYVIRVPQDRKYKAPLPAGTNRRDALREHLASQQIETAIYYPRCLHEQECFAYLGHRTGEFPESEKAASEVLAIPVFSGVTEEQQVRVVETIAAFLS